MSREQALSLAHGWIDAWNRRDLEAVLDHYSEDIELCSPLVVERLGRADGRLRGKAELRAYFARGMGNPALRFDFEDLRLGAGALCLLYRRENGTRVADTMEFGPDGRCIRMTACYARDL